MLVVNGSSFSDIYMSLEGMIVTADRVGNPRWQGMDVSGRPGSDLHELVNIVFEVPLGGIEDLGHWRNDIGPNLPWADDHFDERVGGEPLNPGVQWRNWPWGRSADKFRDNDELFNHTYMERLWPRYARRTLGGRLDLAEHGARRTTDGARPRRGIGWEYGDLQSVVDLLVKEPGTRQAWIPLFHPEDTGYGDGGRKPCTLGYQFMVRNGSIGIWYPLRACDLTHHWKDDCYLAVRLLLWVLGMCREADHGYWDSVVPGGYAMHMTSLHVFENDWRALCRSS